MPARDCEMIVPTLRYREVAAAIDWLQDVLGLTLDHVITDDDGAILFAQLSLGGSVLMVGPVADTAIAMVMAQPDEIDGRESQICYLRVADAEAVRARVLAAGAGIVREYRSRSSAAPCFACRDPEGHIWHLGTYDPSSAPDRMRRRGQRARTGALQAALGLALAANLLLLAGLASRGTQAGERALWGAPLALPVVGATRPPATVALERAGPVQNAQPATSVRTAEPDIAAASARPLPALERDGEWQLDEDLKPRWRQSAEPGDSASAGPATADASELMPAVIDKAPPRPERAAAEGAEPQQPPAPSAASDDPHALDCAISRDPDRRIRACSVVASAGAGPDTAWACNNRAIAYHAKGQSYRAVDGFTEAIARHPRLLEAYVNRAHLYAARHDHGRAIADYTAALAIDAGHARSYAGRGAARAALGQHAAAIADQSAAIAREPAYAVAYAHRALALIAADRLAEAAADAETLLALPVDSATLLALRGRILNALGYRHLGMADLARVAAMAEAP